MRNAIRVLAAAFALTTVLLGSPVTASAAGPMQFTGGTGCLSAGNRTFQCFILFSGGVAPYTASGSTSNNYALINQIVVRPYDPDSELWAQGPCTYGKQTFITLTVSDSSGQSLSVTTSLSCSSQSQI